MGRRCQLCGGKLKNNICVECGLDNSKNDDMYTMEKRECERESLTHTHNEYENPIAGKTMTEEARERAKEAIRRRMKEQKKSAKKNKKAGTYQSSSQYTVSNKTKSKGKTKTVFGVTIIILVTIAKIAGTVFDEVRDNSYEETYSWHEEDYNVEIEETDPYEYVTRELSETGELYEVILTAGLYKAGVHIPEGNYSITLESGEGSLVLNDEENSIYQSYYFGETDEFEENVEQVEDFRVYNGAIIEVVDQAVLHFKSENAQTVASIPNPMTESATLSDGFTVGEDIPAGVYDVKCLEGSGIFDYEIDHGDGYTSYEGKLIGFENSSFTGELKNIVLPEGTKVEILDMTVMLTPSEVIESEDYSSFYPAY